MVFLYNLGIRIYQLLIAIASLFNHKAQLWRNGRKGWKTRLKASIGETKGIVWFHCSSLGEFEQGRPVIEALREKHPDFKILLTFFSPSGYEIRKNYSGADYIFYLPIDTWFNAKTFIEIVNPTAAIFIKYEFWYHYLNQLKKNGIPTYVISAIFRPEQAFFKPYGGWYRKFLLNFEHLFVQNENSKELLASIGVKNVTVAGDTRYDRVIANAQHAKSIPVIEQFAKNSKVLVAGSTWPKDEEIIIEFFKTNPLGLKLIIAPHEIHEQNIEKFIEKIGQRSIRYTQTNGIDPSEANVLVIDTIGILSSVYQYGTIAYIGGGFGVGIHNTLEAAVFGIPVLFGPNYQRFQEAHELIGIGVSKSIGNSDEFSAAMDSFLKSDENLDNARKLSQSFFNSKVGATETIIRTIKL